MAVRGFKKDSLWFGSQQARPGTVVAAWRSRLHYPEEAILRSESASISDSNGGLLTVLAQHGGEKFGKNDFPSRLC
jgi:hypothetical protein